MDKRIEELFELRSYNEETDKDLTMILQSLQWDRKHILQHSTLVSCKYDSNHRVIGTKAEEHERECLLRKNGYTIEDTFLPDPPDTSSSTLVKFSKEEIGLIIEKASKLDTTFKKGVGSGAMEPQSLARLQCAYSPDERRALYDAVVSAAPSCHDLTDLALPSIGNDDQGTKTKSRMEILAELRDMKRRRTKYRVAAKSTNYSDVLRDVIKTQMELYSDALGDIKASTNELNVMNSEYVNTHIKEDSKDNYENRRDFSRAEGRDQDRERYKREKGRIETRHEEQHSRDRRKRDCSRERRRDERNYKDNIHREKSKAIKVEVFDGDTAHRDRSRERRYRRSKDEARDESHRDKQRKPDRDHQDRYRERNDKEHSRWKDWGKRNDKDRQRRRDDRDRHLLDEERARNLVMEIKQEIKDHERIEDRNRANGNTSSINIKQEQMFKDERPKSKEECSRDRHERNRNRERVCEDLSDKDRYERKGSHSREDRERHKRYKDKSHTESRTDRYSHESKKSRTKDKHTFYCEIYSELDNSKDVSDNKNKEG